MFLTRGYQGYMLAVIVVVAFSIFVVPTSDAQLDEKTIAAM